MCAIIGALVHETSDRELADANARLNVIFERSLERGRDGRGWIIHQMPRDPMGKTARRFWNSSKRRLDWGEPVKFFDPGTLIGNVIGNLRAEPTTEYVEEKQANDQQPYRCGPWTIVHNGTIANDKELRTNALQTRIDSAAIVELLAGDHMLGSNSILVAQHFAACVEKLKGSYAIMATHDQHPGMMLVACNYRPIWFAGTPYGTFFASARHYFPEGMGPEMVPPYSAWAFGPGMRARLDTPRATAAKLALVVCSGGLDSVVAATAAQAEGYDVRLLHFMYGSRAEGPEILAIEAVADALEVPYTLFPLPIYKPEDSPLLRKDSKIAGGEAGAEFAHEWVPARNLAMLSVATALAEAGGFEAIILGNNLEEAGAYPDNEPEFIARFNDMLPFAVGDGKRVEVLMPVGNLMKHEIVALGHELGAPLARTWSCYRAGEQHCGTCGPCFMRRTAFRINGLPEVITYANEGE